MMAELVVLPWVQTLIFVHDEKPLAWPSEWISQEIKRITLIGLHWRFDCW